MSRTDWFPFDTRDDYREALLKTGAFTDEECQHKSVVTVPGGSDCEDCPMTWRPDLEEYYYEIDTEEGISDNPADWQDELADEMAESYFDPDDMYGSFKY